MRSVHEADIVRPSESKPTSGTPASVAGTPASKLQRIRLKLSQPKEVGNEHSDHPHETTISVHTGADTDHEETTMPEFGPELDFDDHELAMSSHDLYRVLRRQIHWAEKESAQLRNEWEELRPQREHAWLEKEAIFEDLIHGELRLFSTFVGAPGSSGIAPPAGSLASSLEKLQHQQQQFKHQQDQLQAKSEDVAEAETAEASEAAAAA